MDQQKTAWIIGASSGIGKALALLLVANNWTVAISSRNDSALQKIAQQHTRLFAFPLDITQPHSIDTARDHILDTLGSIDTLFLNAGDYVPMPLEAFNTELFEQLMRINYLGVVNGLNAILPYMQAKQTGEIYVTASLAGYCGLPKAAPYNASKAAVISMVESLHLELKQCGIILRVINPGFVASSLTDKNDFNMPFLISAEQAAEAIYQQMPNTHFEISFPKRMTWTMALLRLLPYRLYFALTSKLLKEKPHAT